MPKVPKINVFYLFYISKIDQTGDCSELSITYSLSDITGSGIS
jgi:hypothetical protein